MGVLSDEELVDRYRAKANAQRDELLNQVVRSSSYARGCVVPCFAQATVQLWSVSCSPWCSVLELWRSAQMLSLILPLKLCSVAAADTAVASRVKPSLHFIPNLLGQRFLSPRHTYRLAPCSWGWRLFIWPSLLPQVSRVHNGEVRSEPHAVGPFTQLLLKRYGSEDSLLLVVSSIRAWTSGGTRVPPGFPSRQSKNHPKGRVHVKRERFRAGAQSIPDNDGTIRGDAYGAAELDPFVCSVDAGCV